jgi:hypothetical protein
MPVEQQWFSVMNIADCPQPALQISSLLLVRFQSCCYGQSLRLHH